MKKKSSKKRSNKERPEKENSTVLHLHARDDEENLDIDWDRFLVYCRETLRKYNSQIEPPGWLSSGLKARIQNIVDKPEYRSKKVLLVAINKMAKSDFLNGRRTVFGKECTFKATFTWLFHHDETFEKVLDGYYDNPPELTPTSEERRRQEAKRIEEEEHERLQRQIREREAGAATPEQLEKIWAQIKLPPLKGDQTPEQK